MPYPICHVCADPVRPDEFCLGCRTHICYYCNDEANFRGKHDKDDHKDGDGDE